MIRVCYFVDAMFLGGAERTVELLATGLDRREFEPSLLVRAAADAGLAAWSERMGEQGIDVRRASMRLPFRPADAWGIYRALASLSPHVVHVNVPGPYDGQMGLAAVLARLAGARGVLVTEHLPMVEPLWKRALVKRWAYRWVDTVTTVCTANVAELVGRHGVGADKVRVVMNGLPASYGSEAADRAAARARFGIAPDRVAVVFVGNLLAHKGLDRVIAALAAESERPWQLVVAGTGPALAGCKSALAERGLSERAQFLGRLQPDEVEALLGAADVLTLPSTIEGLPYVILEAMASAVPVVAGRVAGMPEQVIDGETGFLVDPLDTTALARALAALVDDAALRERMGEAGRRRFRAHFTLDRHVAEMSALYRGLARVGRSNGR